MPTFLSAKQRQILQRLQLQVGVCLAARKTGQDLTRLVRTALAQNEQGLFFDFQRPAALQQLLEQRPGPLRIGVHQPVQRQKLELLVRLIFRFDRSALGLPNLDRQLFGVIHPATLRKRLHERLVGCQSFFELSVFEFAVSLPVVRAFNAVSTFLDELAEQFDRVFILAFVQRPGGFFIHSDGAFTLTFLTLLLAFLSLAFALFCFLLLLRLIRVVIIHFVHGQRRLWRSLGRSLPGVLRGTK